MQTQLRSLRAATTAWQRAQETARALDTRRQHIQSLQRSLSLQYMSEIFERLPDAAKLHWLRIEMHSQHRVLTTLEGSALTTVAALHFRDQLHQLGQASLDQTASDFGRDEPVFVLRLESND